MTSSSFVLDDLTQLAFPSYTQCLYIYTTPSIQSSSHFCEVSSSLCSSFEHTISSSFSFLTHELKRDNNNGGKLTLLNPDSVPNRIDFQEVEGWAPSQQSLDVGNLEGWPVLSKLIGSSVLDEGDHVSVKIRVSWCHAEGEEGGEGGKRSVVVIAGMYSHLLFDGSTRNLFMNEWAAVHRKMFDCEIASLPFPSIPPIFDPSILVGKSSPPAPKPYCIKNYIPATKLKEMFTKSPPKKTTLRVLFPKSVLEKLQNECCNEETKVSKNDCLFALVWKILQTAAPKTVLTPEGVHFGTIPMSVRGRYPGITSRHCGNAVVLSNIIFEDVRKTSLGEIAREVRKTLEKSGKEEYIQSIMDYSHQIPNRELGIYTSAPLGTNFVATQWRNLNMYHTNFGPSLGGTPSLIIPPYDFTGFLFTLPPRPSSSPFPEGDEEEGVIAQFSCFEGDGGEEERKRERERVIEMLPEGARVLTDLNLDVSL